MLEQWLPALTTTGLFAALMMFVKPFAEMVLGRFANHLYDKRLEEHKSTLRERELSFQNHLKETDRKVAALGEFGISSLSERQRLIAARRLDAVEKIWDGVRVNNHFAAAPQFMKNVNMDAIQDSDYAQENIRQFFKTLGGVIPKIEDAKEIFAKNDAWSAKPYIPEAMWSYYSLHQSIILHAVMQLTMLGSGVNPTKVLKDKELAERFETLIPGSNESFEKFGIGYAFHWTQWAEDKILSEIRAFLAGQESETSLAEASEVLELARALKASSDAVVEQ